VEQGKGAMIFPVGMEQADEKQVPAIPRTFYEAADVKSD
jgi:hypothetical protein